MWARLPGVLAGRQLHVENEHETRGASERLVVRRKNDRVDAGE